MRHDPRQLSLRGFGPARPGFTPEQTAQIEAALDWDLDYLNGLDREPGEIRVPLGKRYREAIADVMMTPAGWSSGVRIIKNGVSLGTQGVYFGARSLPAYDRTGAYYWRDETSAWSAAGDDLVRILAADFNDATSAEKARAHLVERGVEPVTPLEECKRTSHSATKSTPGGLPDAPRP